MEGGGGEVKDEKLPPGFRFHPTDEELITYYLINKISDANFSAKAIGDVDLNKCEPWDLPGKAKMGEKEWYFFNLRDRKYPTGVRTNRATNTGYWKTTGKDKEIFNSNTSELVGMKKTLVFYRGRAPRGEKSNWVMHEYRIHSKSVYRATKQDEWVVCRVFQKSAGGKKNPTSSYSRAVLNPYTNPYNNNNNNNVEMIQHPMQSQMMMMQQQQQQPDHQNFQYPGRNYMTPVEIQEYNKLLLRGNIVNQPIQPPANYGMGGSSSNNGCFTISGLNLNLGGGNAALSQPLMRAAPPPPPPEMLVSGDQVEGYGGEMSMNGANAMSGNRFMSMDQDLENYWHSY